MTSAAALARRDCRRFIAKRIANMAAPGVDSADGVIVSANTAWGKKKALT
jgi:hypothetical protein